LIIGFAVFPKVRWKSDQNAVFVSRLTPFSANHGVIGE
jgi:hypothetical protein